MRRLNNKILDPSITFYTWIKSLH